MKHKQISKGLKLESYKKACQLYPDDTPNVTQGELHSLRMGVQVGWILCKQEVTDKAWNFINDNLLEYTGLDSYAVEESFNQVMNS